MGKKVFNSEVEENNPIKSEIKGLIEGLNWCIRLNKRKLLVYSDNDTVVSCLRGKTKHQSKELEILTNIISKNRLSILVEKVKNKDGNKYLELSDKLSREVGEETINKIIYEICEDLKKNKEVRKIEVIKLDKSFFELTKKVGKDRSDREEQKRGVPQKNGKTWSEVVRTTLPQKKDESLNMLVQKLIKLINSELK